MKNTFKRQLNNAAYNDDNDNKITSKQILETVGKILRSLGGGSFCSGKSGLLINFDKRDAAEKN